MNVGNEPRKLLISQTGPWCQVSGWHHLQGSANNICMGVRAVQLVELGYDLPWSAEQCCSARGRLCSLWDTQPGCAFPRREGGCHHLQEWPWEDFPFLTRISLAHSVINDTPLLKWSPLRWAENDWSGGSDPAQQLPCGMTWRGTMYWSWGILGDAQEAPTPGWQHTLLLICSASEQSSNTPANERKVQGAAAAALQPMNVMWCCRGISAGTKLEPCDSSAISSLEHHVTA